MLEQINNVVDNFNAISSRYGRVSRLNVVMLDEECGTLYLGTEEQFGYGNYQCELCSTQTSDTLFRVVNSMLMVLCMETGM